MSPARRATTIALPAALIAGLATAWIISGNISDDEPSADTGPLSTVTVQEVEGTADQCANLVIGLPDKIQGNTKRAVTGHPGALAWGDPPTTLVCGVAKPDGLEMAQFTAVNGVTWLVEQDVDTSAYGVPGDNVLWTAVDREVYVSVAVPVEISGSGVISPISSVIGQRLQSTGA